MNFPDPGAFVTVYMKSGKHFDGFIHPGHTWAGEGMLCLAQDADHGLAGDTVYHYVKVDDVEAWTWDCKN
jgi:hypothetical protein